MSEALPRDKRRDIVESTLVPHTAFALVSQKLDQCYRFANTASEPICLAIIGESRTGKSRALEEFESRHKPRRGSEGLTSGILRLTAPSRPTVKSFAELLLERIGDPLFDKGTENAKTSRIRRLMRETGVRTLMIDEFHHFVDKGSLLVMHHVADWLKVLVDQTRAALVVAGLPSCQGVLEQNEQLAGRFLAPLMMPRFDWQIEAQREEFMDILGAFHESISAHFDMPLLDSEELAFRTYCATGGLMGYLTKFLRQAVWNAIDSGKGAIELEDLASANSEAVWAKAGPTGTPNPFTREFRPAPTADLIERIKGIGVAMTPPPPPRRRRRPPEPLTVQSVLSAS